MKRHILVGAGAAIVLLLVYLGIISLVQGVGHALEQALSLWYWVLALSIGFGIQVGLFSFMRQGMRQRGAAATASVATSGGISAGSMAACCAHHLSDVLPILGLSGLSIFLVRYQLFFIIAGSLSNVVGITIMLETIQRHKLCPWLGHWKVNLGWVKRGVIIAGVVILAISFFLIPGIG